MTETSPSPRDGVAERAAAVIDRAGALVARVRGHVGRLATDVARDARAVAAEAEALYAALADGARAAGGAVRGSPRLGRLLGEAAAIAAAYRAVTALGGEPGEALHARCARRAHDVAADLRGPILKVGQLAAARADLLPPAWTRELLRLTDRVPPVDPAAILTRIDAEIGAGRFAAIDPEPLAAASLAQVHAATLHDGTRVAVKVQVPGVEDAVDADLAALRAVAAAVDATAPSLGLGTIAAELARAIRAELDYRAEAASAARVAAVHAGDPDVIVPGVHAELSTRRVLTLARVDGERLVDYLAGAGAAARDHVLATLVRTTAEQIFVHGCFQADPHPGNFLVVSGDDPARPRLALLDFGCVATLDGPVRAAYARLCLSLFGGDGAGAAEGLAALGFVARDGDSRSVVRVADAMLAALRRGVRLDDPAFDPAAALADAFALARRHPVAAPAHFVLIGRVLATLGGLLFAHRPAIQPFALIAPALSGAAR